MRYFNYKYNTCYIERQLPNLPAHLKEDLVEIEDSYWREIVRLVNEEGYRVKVEGKIPVAYQSEDINS